MKSRLQLNIKNYFCFILIVSLLAAFLTGCSSPASKESSEISSSEIGSGLDASSSTDSEPALPGVEPDFTGDIIAIGVYFSPDIYNLQPFEEIWDETRQTSNHFLASIGKEYRLSFELIQPDYESFDHYQDYNIILNMPSFSPESLIEEHFLELTEELHSGSLTPLYQSEPEKYWKLMEQNGKIYSPIIAASEIAEALWVDLDALEELGITEQDIISLKGKPLSEWLPLFETIYILNNNQPFIYSPFRNTFNGQTFCTSPLHEIAWATHFQMVGPMIGISYDEPEKGAQFVLESDYADQTLAFWKDLNEKGYIINTDHSKKEIYPLIWYQSTNSIDMAKKESNIIGMEDGTDTSLLICPLEGQLHSVCRSAWDTSRYSFLIPKNQTNLALTFQFINEMAEDPSFAAGIMLTDDSFLPDYVLSPIARSFCHETFFIDPDQRRVSAENTVLPQDTGFIYTPADSANLQKGIAFEYSGGVSHFDSTAFLMETSEDWLHFDERLEALKAMYHEEGIDEMIAEANEQLTQFRSHS